MKFFRGSMPIAARRAYDRANEQRVIEDRVQMRSRRAAPGGKQPGVWQSLLAILDRADEAKQIAEDAKATADKASRPARAAAEKLIRSRSTQ